MFKALPQLSSCLACRYGSMRMLSLASSHKCSYVIGQHHHSSGVTVSRVHLVAGKI